VRMAPGPLRMERRWGVSGIHHHAGLIFGHSPGVRRASGALRAV
jgi:hypothetical protein